MTVRLRVGAATDQGRVRTINQDSYRLLPESDLYIVADGMGGHRGGEVAAAMAVEHIGDSYDDPSPDGLRAAVLAANRAIYDRSVDDAELRGMGTTAVVAALVEPEAPSSGTAGQDHDDPGTGEAAPAADQGADASEPTGASSGGSGSSEAAGEGTEAGDGETGGQPQLVIANVGDSRAYVYRDGELIQLTEDHSMVADLVRQGQISQDEADVHPQRNIVTRVLGVYEHIEVDLWPVDPVTGDRFVLCSDGLFNEVGDAAIGGVLRRLDDPTEAAEELVRLANEGGGRDNITVVVVDVVDDGGAAARASAALGRADRSRSEPDLAGFSSATGSGLDAEDIDADAEGPAPAPTRRGRRAAGREGDRPGSRFTWRVAVFLVLIAAVLGGAYATVVWYGTSTYFVGYDEDDAVVIFQGRPGGLLWIDPTVKEPTVLTRARVPARYDRTIDAGREFAHLSEARTFVDRVRDDAGLDESGVPTTTTTRPPTTTTSPDDTADTDDTDAGDTTAGN